MSVTALSFIGFLAVFVIIGVLSVLKNRHTSTDYLIASHSIKPWLVALSAVATNNSGYMFIGLIGYTYAFGLQAIWLMIGWIVGDMLASFFIHKRLRTANEDTRALSYGSTLARWTGQDMKFVRWAAGIITVLFLGTYAAAQLSAGSKALHVLFGWDYAMGAVIGAAIVLAYCFAGGIRASIWTDAAQSFVMFVAMILMCVLTIQHTGGLNDFVSGLQAQGPEYMALFPSGLQFGALAFVISWVFAGIGVIGQPHIMVRFMAMEDAEQMGRVRIYYYSWYILFTLLCYGTGFAARLLIPEAAGFDAELALPELAIELLPPVLVGMVLAGLFAATMSTADSQILSCTAAVTHDLSPHERVKYWMTKGVTVLVTAVALGIALFGDDSVFDLVVFAWSALAAAFAPLLMVLVMNQKPGQILSLTMMLGGVSTALYWRWLGYGDSVYEVLPGILAGLVLFLTGKLFGFSTKKD